MRVIIQAGHEGRTTGATGAPGEKTFTTDVANRVADSLRAKGVEVKRIAADPTAAEVNGNWDLFLAIHYDADTYNADGGFTDYPEPSTDGATEKSQAIAKTLAAEYFPITGIKNVPSRSNKNTRFYYMWKMLSSKTPCVIIECGVGNRKPNDYDPLNTDRDVVVMGIVIGIRKALGIDTGEIMANMYTMPSGKQVDLGNAESMKVVANVYDEVINQQLYVKKVDAVIEEARAVKAAVDEKNRELEQLKKDHEAAMLEQESAVSAGTRAEIIAAVASGVSVTPVDGTVTGLISAIKERIAQSIPPGSENGGGTTTLPTVDGQKWAENGLTVEVTEGNIKKITNYRRL
jgi:type II secretory pathway component PulM